MKIIVFVAAFFGFLQVSYGWGADGHMMIAEIAQSMLTDKAMEIVTQFIGNNRTLADVAPLPDDYAFTPQGNWSRPCHFCNLPRGATNFTYPEDCPGFCVVRSIFNYTDILRKTQANPTECAFGTGVEPCALIFLVHFVGDVHQPLHVGFGYDEGGNLVPVTFYNEPTELHHVWDDNMIWKWSDNNWQQGESDLENIMSNETGTVKDYIKVTNPIDWADESFHYVLTTCYDYGNGSIVDDTPELGEWYYDKNILIVQQRLIAAGVRLGTLLNNILVG